MPRSPISHRRRSALETGPEYFADMPAAPPPAPPLSPAPGFALNAVAATPAAPNLPDRWERAEAAIGNLAYAVEHDLGGDVVRAAREDGAKALAEHVDGATGDDLGKRTEFWSRRLRLMTGPDGRSLDRAHLIAIRGDVAAIQLQSAAAAEHGVKFGQLGTNDYILRAKESGDRLITLPRSVGYNVVEDPERYKAQLGLLRAAYGKGEDEALFSRALAIFSHIHEQEHAAADIRAMVQPTAYRAQAYVAAVNRLRAAEKDDDRREAEGILRTILFAEADSLNDLAQFLFDAFTPAGRVNAADDLQKDAAEAYEAFKDGRFLDGLGASFWTIADGAAVVGGVRFAKIFAKTNASRTKLGRRIIAARELARAESRAGKKLKKINAERMLGRRLWQSYDAEEQEYLEGLMSGAKGVVGEEAMRKYLVDLQANPARGVGTAEGEGRTLTRLDLFDEHRIGKDGKPLGPRFYDEVLNDTALERVFGMFLRPVRTPGLTTRVEAKVDRAQSVGKQAEKDGIVADNLREYKTHDLVTLRAPYDELSKEKIREQVIKWMNSDSGGGAKRVKGLKKYKTIDREKVLVK